MGTAYNEPQRVHHILRPWLVLLESLQERDRQPLESSSYVFIIYESLLNVKTVGGRLPETQAKSEQPFITAVGHDEFCWQRRQTHVHQISNENIHALSLDQPL